LVKHPDVYGVDFSGAKEAGRNIWIAKAEPFRPAAKGCARLELLELSSLEKLSGTSAREPALAHLRERISASTDALWAMDFPFGLPVEVFDRGTRWPAQLAFLRDWRGDAYSAGLEFLRRARARGGPMHIRRDTDREAKAPFDCYHYRIIYQTFFGMRDVLLPLSRTRGTAVLPFQYGRLAAAQRVLLESCPSSTLKRLRLPHQNYKQPSGGPLTSKRLRTRRAILDGLVRHVEIGDAHRRVIMRNGGGDALDAVIAAVGGYQSWATCDHDRVAKHRRYRREGYLYV
jgi:hypothetical protein